MAATAFAALGAMAIAKHFDSEDEDGLPLDELDDLKTELVSFQWKIRQLETDLRRLRQASDPDIKERTRKQVLEFNRLVQIMERCDALKVTDRVMYDRDDRGREVIRECNGIMERLDKVKPH